MAYVILEHKRSGGGWSMASTKLFAFEHAAAFAQKNIERDRPEFETARVWLDIPDISARRDAERKL